MSLAAIDSPYPSSPAQVEALARDGHVALPGLLSRAEVEAFRPALLEAAARARALVSPEERQLFLLPSLWQIDARARELVWSPRLAQVAQALLAVPSVRLWRDVAFFKDPGEPETPWHQDRHWEPVETARFVGLWIALGDVTPEMSALEYASGSHREGRITLPDHEGRSQAAITRFVESRFPVAGHGPLRAGDATAHLGWTLHRSPANTSAVRREALSVFYFEDGARIERAAPGGDPAWQRVQRQHVETRFPGRSPGEPAESELCPVLWPR